MPIADSIMPASKIPLRDIYLPDPVDWWPPAVGWWILCGLILLLVLVMIKWIQYRRRIKYSVATQAQHALQIIRDEYNNNNEGQYLVEEISALCRRVCISLFPREQTASLVGEEWLLFLDQCMVAENGDRPFSQGIGRVLLEAPYRYGIEIDGYLLLLLCEQWIPAVQKYADTS